MDVSFTEDYGVYVVCMHINSAVNTVVTAVVLLLLAKHTPPSMKTYKWYLVNVTVSCFALDFFMDLFFIPVTVQPILGGCSLGLLRPIGYMATVINWQLFGLFLGMSGISLLYAMMYRAASVYNKAHILAKKPVIILMAFVQIFYSSPSIILVLSVYPGNEKSIEYIRENYPKALDFFQTHSCSLMSIGIAPLIPYICVALILILTTVTVDTFFVMIVRHGLRKIRNQVTDKTYRMQRQLAMSLLIQMVIPTGMISVSYIAFAVAGGLQLKSARVVSFCTFLFSTFHTTANGLIMIATIKPYRLAFLRYFRTFVPLHKIYKSTSSMSHTANQSRDPTFTVSRISRVSSISVQRE
ncbi:serpentine type 7TM GPCR chemoreceptor srh domain-containing protein [Ditylenchus destructor]|nr:serpentine type 7TM GPCR chemoreceptor srh domain-containing protein [Ditylenchus destructor]